ncbi:uncharacterized protein LOC131889923 [Tigriopus californicus]|nr:uncharacterized protein LOC131889923 [Tigriopus californicus]XP_059095131.1 uncharacterized protein LOC131889923 [Tigriopus californicus]XP_059095132.1 uncharacterized protein LOC131889923 [Tigriopus californicus]
MEKNGQVQDWRAYSSIWSDEGYSSPKCRDTQRKLVLLPYFSVWRAFAEHRQSLRTKAEFYYRYNVLELYFGTWKAEWRRVKVLSRAEMEKLEQDRLEETNTEAQEFYAKMILTRYFRIWRACVVLIGLNPAHRGHRRPNVRSRIDSYIESTQTARNRVKVGVRSPIRRGRQTAYSWRRNHIRTEPPLSKTLISTSARIMDLHIPNSSQSLTEGAIKTFEFQWGLGRDSEFSNMNGETTDIHTKLLPTITGHAPESLPLNANFDDLPENDKDRKIELQKLLIQEQRNRLRDQQRHIYDLEVMKQQYLAGHPITNKELLHQVLKPMNGNGEYDWNGKHTIPLSARSLTPKLRHEWTGLESVLEESDLPEISNDKKLYHPNMGLNGLNPYNLFRPEVRQNKTHEVPAFHKLKAAERRQKMAQIKSQKERDFQDEQTRRREQLKLRKGRKKQLQLLSEKYQNQMILADDFNRQLSLNSYGLRPWRKLVTDTHLNEFIAEKHCEHSSLKKCFSAWAQMTRWVVATKKAKADNFHRITILNRWLAKWIEVLVP